MAEILKGAPAAKALNAETLQRVKNLRASGVVPKLAILRVGERQDDVAYETAARKRCASLEIAVQRVLLPADCEQAELLSAIDALNSDDTVHGVLMFRPLPKHLDESAACQRLSPNKDVDGITSGSMAKVYSGAGAGFAPCTAEAVLELLRHYEVPISGKRVAVIGRSLIIGRPVAMLLMRANATVTLCHSRTENLSEITQSADVVVAALGKAEAIGRDYLRPGQTVVDVGIHYSEARQCMVGDVDFAAAEQIVKAITPVPGGVGSLTTAILASHVIQAAEQTE